MKRSKMIFALFAVVSLALMASGCGGGGGGSNGGTGTVAMSITDAKPMLEEPPGKEITSVWVTIDEVLVHKDGGGWVSLPLPDNQDPFEIDLMQYQVGDTTQIVPIVRIDEGKYTQIRLSVVSARIVFNNATNPQAEPDNFVDVTVPSEFLRTDKNFDFTVPNEQPTQTPPVQAAVDLTIDFDLSKSLVREGNGQYKLKPVLHLVKTEAAATIEGTITGLGPNGANVYVRDLSVNEDPNDNAPVFSEDGDIYTILKVDQQDPNYSVYWLVPGHTYRIEVDFDPVNGSPDIDSTSPPITLGPGQVRTNVSF